MCTAPGRLCSLIGQSRRVIRCDGRSLRPRVVRIPGIVAAQTCPDDAVDPDLRDFFQTRNVDFDARTKRYSTTHRDVQYSILSRDAENKNERVSRSSSSSSSRRNFIRQSYEIYYLRNRLRFVTIDISSAHNRMIVNNRTHARIGARARRNTQMQ